MRNNYRFTTLISAKTASTFAMLSFMSFFIQSANAQTFYGTVSSSKLEMNASSDGKKGGGIKSEGAYLIKDGQLDEIYKLKLLLPSALLDSVLKDKKVVFEQTHVMILPLMSMVHFVGTLEVDGIKTTTSLQLGFKVNSDQSIAFKGTKLLKLSDLVKDLPKDELKLDIDFVLKNSKNDLVTLTAK